MKKFKLIVISILLALSFSISAKPESECQVKPLSLMLNGNIPITKGLDDFYAALDSAGYDEHYWKSSRWGTVYGFEDCEILVEEDDVSEDGEVSSVIVFLYDSFQDWESAIALYEKVIDRIVAIEGTEDALCNYSARKIEDPNARKQAVAEKTSMYETYFRKGTYDTWFGIITVKIVVYLDEYRVCIVYDPFFDGIKKK